MNNKRRKNPLAVFLGIIWSFILVGYIVFFADLFLVSDNYTYEIGADYLIRRVSEQNYSQIYDSVQNTVYQSEEQMANPEYAEIMAISDYVEAAFRHKAYAENGQTELANMFYEKMILAKSRMGKLDFAAADIDERINSIE